MKLTRLDLRTKRLCALGIRVIVRKVAKSLASLSVWRWRFLALSMGAWFSHKKPMVVSVCARISGLLAVVAFNAAIHFFFHIGALGAEVIGGFEPQLPREHIDIIKQLAARDF